MKNSSSKRRSLTPNQTPTKSTEKGNYTNQIETITSASHQGLTAASRQHQFESPSSQKMKMSEIEEKLFETKENPNSLNSPKEYFRFFLTLDENDHFRPFT